MSSIPGRRAAGGSGSSGRWKPAGERRQRRQLDRRKPRQRYRRHQTGGERIGLGARELSERRWHGWRIGRSGDPIREPPRPCARSLRPRREGAPARVQVGEEALAAGSEANRARHVPPLSARLAGASGLRRERARPRARRATHRSARRRELRRGVVELATEIGGRTARAQRVPRAHVAASLRARPPRRPGLRPQRRAGSPGQGRERRRVRSP